MTDEKMTPNEPENQDRQSHASVREDEILSAAEKANAEALKKKKREAFFIKIVALAFAIVLWGIVVLNENPVRSIWLYDIPVQITNREVLAERNLIILKEETMYIDIRLEGKQNVLTGISDEQIIAGINLKDVTEAGVVSIPATVTIPGVESVTVKEQKRVSGSLEIDKIEEVTLPIKPKITGEQAMKNGYALTAATVSPDSIVVKAPSSIINTLNIVTDSVDISEKTESGSCEVAISVLDASGTPVSTLGYEPKVTTLSYILSITNSVKIEANLENANKLSSRYDIFASAVVPDTITVKGDDTAMRQLNKISTESIDVLAMYEGFERGFLTASEWNDASFYKKVTVPLVFPEGISAASVDTPPEVELTITFKNLSSDSEPYEIDSDGTPVSSSDNERTEEEE